VMSLAENHTQASHRGEETHVSPDSSDMIDIFLDFFPWEDNSNASNAPRTPPLRLEDIEIQINYRTPRIDHLVSIWHQLGRKKNLKKFVKSLGSTRRGKETAFYQLNSLALALQFVRKGIKTTIIDMKGVKEKESKNSAQNSSQNNLEEGIGGLQGVVACDILKMGDNREATDVFCDDEGILHLSNYNVPVETKNKKKDKSKRRLTDKQMEDINRVYEEYDCGVLKHLKKYQEKGLLRILYPSEHLFETCNSSSPDISFYDTTLRAQTIASRNSRNETWN